MKSNAFLALILALPTMAAAQTSVVQRCDKPLEDVETMARMVSDCDSFLKAHSAALAKPVIDGAGAPERIVTSSSPFPPALARAAMDEKLQSRLIAYYGYSAFASGSKAGCSTLAHLGKPQEERCLLLYGDLDFSRARFGTPAQFSAACRAVSGAGSGACCDVISAAFGKPNPCATVAGKCADAGSCRAYFGSYAGDPRSCASIPAPSPEECKGEGCETQRAQDIANCEADAAFSRARKAGGAAACGGNQRCRVLLGEGKAVAAEIAAKDLNNPVGAWFLKSAWKVQVTVDRQREAPKPQAPANVPAGNKSLDFRAFVCAEPINSDKNRAAVISVQNAAQLCLTDVEGALSNPTAEVTSLIDERLERIARANLRVNAVFDRRPAKTAAPKAAAPAAK